MYYNNRPQKILLARYGYHPVFGKDVDIREHMSEEEALQRFEIVWKHELRNAVLRAERCDPEDASRKLKPKEEAFFDKTQEHREFICKDGLFIAQLKLISLNSYELSQLWFIRSSSADPRTLFVKFDTVITRQRFEQVCQELGWDDEELSRRILIDLMHNFVASSWQDIMKRII